MIAAPQNPLLRLDVRVLVEEHCADCRGFVVVVVDGPTTAGYAVGARAGAGVCQPEIRRRETSGATDSSESASKPPLAAAKLATKLGGSSMANHPRFGPPPRRPLPSGD